MKFSCRARAASLTCLALGLTGCFKISNDIPDAKAPDVLLTGTGVGGACARLLDCRNGLTCAPSGTCQPVGNKPQDAACVLSAECLPGYYCSQALLCAPVGQGAPNSVCNSDGDCASGLMCNLDGLTGLCTPPGSGDYGTACQQNAQCMAGLMCIAGLCQKLATAAATAAWTGATCNTPPSDRPSILFHVPRTTDAVSDDFYRLPFPNDIRFKNGKLSLQGHPRPGAQLLSFDPVDRYISAIESDVSGFGTNQAIFLRFSQGPSLDSMNAPGAVSLVDITPTSPEYARDFGLSWTFSTDRTAYLCEHNMVIRPALGHPLRPKTTYALFLRGIATEAGVPFEQDHDFAAMLSAAAPTEPELAAAWATYAPLRTYLLDTADSGRPQAADLSVAVVFTTQAVEDPLAAIDAAVAAGPAPALASPLVLCGSGQVSPCDDQKTGVDHQRGCIASATPAPYDEYQGLLQLPVFQQGIAPYEKPEDGGNIALDANGQATPVAFENVCFALTVPKGTPPAAGWPMVVYSHGTGGSYRSAIELGLAADFAEGAGKHGTFVPMATFGYDGILHGTRSNGSLKPVNELVYNFLNPRAARDNMLQAAADLLAIPRAVSTLAEQSISIDGAHLALYGHSQGGNAAALAAGRDAGYAGVVLSGTGGLLTLSLLEKRQPVDIATAMPMLLNDPWVDSNHPVLSLMQLYFERSDSINFAPRLFTEPLPGAKPRHVLHVYGTDDTYAPVETQRRYALAANMQVALPLVDNYVDAGDFGLAKIASPIKANQAFGSLGMITAAQIQYQPSGYDGHFVSTANSEARAAIQNMLVTMMQDAAPTVEP